MNSEDKRFLVDLLQDLGYYNLSEGVKEILAENEKLKEINGKLSDRLSWKLSDEPFYRVK